MGRHSVTPPTSTRSVRGGQILYWYAPGWRKALYLAGIRRHRKWLGDIGRADRIDVLNEQMRGRSS